MHSFSFAVSLRSISKLPFRKIETNQETAGGNRFLSTWVTTVTRIWGQNDEKEKDTEKEHKNLDKSSQWVSGSTSEILR